jgi:hypothetical protein
MLERTITLPKRGRGRPGADAMAQYERELETFCRRLTEIDSGLDFKVSSRGWAYILEEYGLTKGDFDAAERLITECRKKGHLPVDFCAEDEGRSVDHLEEINHETVEAFAQGWVDYLADAHEQFTPFSRTPPAIACSRRPGNGPAFLFQPFANLQVEYERLPIGPRRSVISPQLTSTRRKCHEHW